MGRPPDAPESGFTLVEVMIAMVVMVLGFLALAQVILAGNSLRRSTDERAKIHAALHIVQSELRLVSEDARTNRLTWASVVADSVAAGGEIGPTFDVAGLERVSSSTPVGSIRVVTDERLDDSSLAVKLGLPRDLDADGLVDNPDVTTTASLLPVVITLRWRGLQGVRTVRHGVFVSAY